MQAKLPADKFSAHNGGWKRKPEGRVPARGRPGADGLESAHCPSGVAPMRVSLLAAMRVFLLAPIVLCLGAFGSAPALASIAAVRSRAHRQCSPAKM